MKNIITVAALLAAGTAFANAETVVSGTDGSATGTGNNYTAITGFKVDLSALDWSSDFSNNVTTFTLTSIDFTSTKGNHTAAKFYSGDLYAFIYEGSIAPNSVTADTATVAVSTSAITWNSGTASNSGTWNFNNVVLDLTKTYSVLFSSSADSFVSAKGNSGSGEGIRSEITNNDVSAIFAANYNGSAFLDSGSSKNGVNATLHGAVVPEPSAFGLLAGAGALALVAARRRHRKA